MRFKTIDYTLKKMNIKGNIVLCPNCGRMSLKQELNNGYINYIHEEKIFVLKPLPVVVCVVPKILANAK